MASGYAMGFLQTYEKALQNDKRLQVVSAQTQAAQEAVPQARARLLPQLSWTSTRYQVDQSRKDATRSFPDQSYRSESDGLVLRQPVFQPRLWAGLRQTQAAVRASEETLASEQQNLMVRVAERYFDLILADTRIATVKAQETSAREQLMAAKKALAAGAGTRTDLLEVQAQLDRIQATALQASQARLTALVQFELLTGEPLKAEGWLALRPFALTPFVPQDSLDAWVQKAYAGNKDLAAAAERVQAAENALRAAGYEHYPSLELVAQSVRSASEETLLVNSETKTQSVGFVLTIPLYQGGAISSRERQLQASLTEVRQQMALAQDNLKLEIARTFYGLREGELSIKALEKALASNQEALVANQKSFLAGVRRSLDVLAAEQRLSQTQLDLQTARLQFLLAWVRLQALTGNASYELAQQFDALFQASSGS
jgi:TolC family type I secretion outer membrane protein